MTWPRSCAAPGSGASADGKHVVVDPLALRALAGPAATEDWEQGLAGMVAYAAGKGWVETDGGLLAHIERRDGAAESATAGSLHSCTP